MVKKFMFLLPLSILLAAAVWVIAAGGADDPLVSLSYLTDAFMKQAEEEIDGVLDESDTALLEELKSEESENNIAATWKETRLKKGDILQGTAGTNVLLLAGSMQVDFSSGAVVNVTTGEAVASGSSLAANNRYMVAEDTTAQFKVTTRTAVVDYQGEYAFTYSEETDYNAMAYALKRLNLFYGSATGYGSGFDLEVQPTRLQAIIMFVRILGEEDEAMAWTGGTHFYDIEKNSLAEKYVGYAYHKGYTNGYQLDANGNPLFRPGYKVNARQYVEFLLRAMGYSSFTNGDLSITLNRAVESGVLTEGEVALLQSETFLRAHLVYVSYYALDAVLPDGESTLSGQLREKGVFTRNDWREALEMVPGWRV